MVSVLLANLGEGQTQDAIMQAYHIAADDIRAAVLFAADMADDQYFPIEQGAA